MNLRDKLRAVGGSSAGGTARPPMGEIGTDGKKTAMYLLRELTK